MNTLKEIVVKLVALIGLEIVDVIGPIKIGAMIILGLVMMLLVWRFRARIRLKWALLTIVLAALVGIVVLVIWAGFWLLFLSLVLLPILIFWIRKSFQAVDGKETGLVLMRGVPTEVVGPGWCFVPWPFGRVVRYGTGMIDCDYGVVQMLTSPGEWPLGSGQMLKGVPVSLRMSATVYWPRKGDTHSVGVAPNVINVPDLFDTYQVLPTPPVSAEDLGAALFSAIFSIARDVVANTTPVDLILNRQAVYDRIKNDCLAQVNNPIKEARLNRILIVFEEIRLPRKFEEMLAAPRVAALQKQVAEQEAEAEALAIEAKGQAYAQLGPIGVQYAPVLTLFHSWLMEREQNKPAQGQAQEQDRQGGGGGGGGDKKQGPLTGDDIKKFYTKA